MNLHQAIADRFELDVRYNGWQKIHCPLHDDSDVSAGINFVLGGFNCFVCGGKKLWTLAKECHIDYEKGNEYEQDEVDISFTNGFIRQPEIKIKTLVKELSDFLIERRILYDTIEKWNAKFINDRDNKENLYGYLVFNIGKGYAARKIIPDALGERFRNKKGIDKGLLGKENLKSFESKDQVILLEGITDFLTMHQLGYKNIVCSMGAKISDDQAYLLRDKTVFIIFDRDYPGYSGSHKAAEKLREYGSIPIIVELPDNGTDKNDVNDMYCKDEDSLKMFLNEQLTKHNTYDKDYVSTLRKKKQTSRVWKTGIPKLDSIFLGGFGEGVYAYSGEEGIGKSTTVSAHCHSFVEQEAKVFLASYELSKLQEWARVVSKYSKHSWQEIEQDFSLIDKEWNGQLERLASHLKIEIGSTADDLLAARNSFDIFIIDYIQRMPPMKAGMDIHNAVVQNNKALSEMMAKYNKTIVMISSMPRSAYNSDTAPMFKESGDLEYTVQGAIRMRKMAKDVISFLVKKNTRGESGQTIFTVVDWKHQTLTQMSDADVTNKLLK